MIAINAHIDEASGFMSRVGVVDLGPNKSTLERTDCRLDDLWLLVLLVNEELELGEKELSGAGVVAVDRARQKLQAMLGRPMSGPQLRSLTFLS